jgi:photosystem II stability/assembly factor-like uncharacterized protein
MDLGTTEDVNALNFIDENNGYVATNITALVSGISHLYKTAEGGQNFTIINTGIPMYFRTIFL